MANSKDEKVTSTTSSVTAVPEYKSPLNPADYGIDYSQEQRDAISKIFQDAATAAYGTAQNQFSNSMAQQQATLSDTIRRSQAQAVATGASRGMQAANELSSILGLQQAAAQEASAMQGTYAEALANASKSAYDVQNAANQVGAQMYAADSATAGQQYAADISDPYRILNVAMDLKNSGQSAAADMLLQSFLASSGVSEGAAQSAISGVNNPIGADGKALTSSWITGTTNNVRHVGGDNFNFTLDGTKYKLEVGSKANAEITAAAKGLKANTPFIYDGIAYIKLGSDKVYRVGGRGTAGKNKEGGAYGNFKAALQSRCQVLK